MICFILLTENNFIGNINDYTIQSNDIILQFYNFIRKIRQSIYDLLFIKFKHHKCELINKQNF